MPKQVKFFHKFLLVMIVIVAVPLLIQGVKMININRDALRVSVLETHTKLAQAVAAEIDNYISRINLDLAFVLALERFHQMSWDEKTKVLLSILSRHKDFILISVLNGNGIEMIKVYNPTFLKESFERVSRRDDLAFKEAKRTGIPQLGNVYYDGDLPRINAVYPLEARDEYVFVTVSLTELWKKIEAMQMGKTGFAFLIDKEGRVIFHPRLSTTKHFEKLVWHPLVMEALAGSGNPRGIAVAAQTNSESNPIKVVGSYAWPKSIGWGVIMEQAEQEAFSSLNLMKANAIFWMVISILVSVLVAFFLAKSLSQPILELIKGAEKLGEGDFSYEVKVKTHDEISILANTFNFMVKKLKEFQDALVQREKLAAIGQMASVVGHEIRNPLGVINNAVYYIKTKLESALGNKLDPKVQKHIGIIEKEIAVSNKIINDLLGFSRTRPPMAQPNDLNGIVENCLSVVSIPERIKVELDLGSDLPPVLVNQDEMRQVFVNLINNACDAMPDGGSLKIRTYLEADMAQVEVADTGCGISPENMEKLFTPFFSTKAKGTGLGLAAVHRILERHKGKIKVRSKLGEGTTFVVSLPLAK